MLPRFPSRRLLPEKLARLRVFDGAVVTRGRGQGTEFDVLREYVIGDDVRSIDWRASARAHDVVVRTWRPERDRRVICVLDTGRTSAARIGDEPRLDAAIDAALLLAVLATRADDRVDLLALDTARAGPGRGRRAPDQAAPADQRDGGAGTGAGRDGLRAGRRRAAAPRPQAVAGGDLHRAGRGADRRGPAADAVPAGHPAPGGAGQRARPGDGPLAELPPQGATADRRARGRGRRAGAGRARPGARAAGAAGRARGGRAARTASPRRSPTST